MHVCPCRALCERAQRKADIRHPTTALFLPSPIPGLSTAELNRLNYAISPLPSHPPQPFPLLLNSPPPIQFLLHSHSNDSPPPPPPPPLYPLPLFPSFSDVGLKLAHGGKWWLTMFKHALIKLACERVSFRAAQRGRTLGLTVTDRQMDGKEPVSVQERHACHNTSWKTSVPSKSCHCTGSVRVHLCLNAYLKHKR